MTNLNTAARAYALSLDAQCPPSPTESFEAGWEAAQGEIERLRNIITGCPVCSELERNIKPADEPNVFPTEAEIDAAFPAVAAGAIAEVQRFSALSRKEFAELAWSTLIDVAWGQTMMLFELCARVSPEWVQERLAATSQKSNPAPSASSSGCFYPNCDCLCSEARESLGQLAKSSEVPRDRACDCSLGLCSKASRAPDQYCRINPP